MNVFVYLANKLVYVTNNDVYDLQTGIQGNESPCHREAVGGSDENGRSIEVNRDVMAGTVFANATALSRGIAFGDLHQSAPACFPWQAAPKGQGERRRELRGKFPPGTRPARPCSVPHPNLRLAVDTAAPVADLKSRVGLIEQSKRPGGDGFPIRPLSTRPAGLIPAGATEGESL
jgi:hypothetical protein